MYFRASQMCPSYDYIAMHLVLIQLVIGMVHVIHGSKFIYNNI
jgi:hypothetical protein